VANTYVTPTWVAREMLYYLHQKANFIRHINRQYDSTFEGVGGAKIGAALTARLPNQFTVRTGAGMAVQDVTEQSITIPMATQKGVDLNDTSVDFTLNISQADFRARVIEPASAVLVANVEADALSMFKDVMNQVNNIGAAATLNKLLLARKSLNDNLARMDNSRTVILCTQDNVDLITDTKGLFQDSDSISEQYVEGMMGRTAGFNFFENTLLPKFTTGSDASGYLVVGAGQTGAAVTINAGAGGTFKKGDIVTFAGCNRCHPESKADTGSLQQFTITADYAGGAGNIAISPAIVVAGATQNVTASPNNGGAVSKQGGASAVHGVSLAFHKDAFTFVTAPLPLPRNQQMAARAEVDGISLRIWQGTDITNDKFPTRLDILYGYKTLRGQLACRSANN
jgi:hypothetical protein